MRLPQKFGQLYPVHVTTRKSFGLMTRKLSVTKSRHLCQFLGTLSRKKSSVASANCPLRTLTEQSVGVQLLTLLVRYFAARATFCLRRCHQFQGVERTAYPGMELPNPGHDLVTETGTVEYAVVTDLLL